MKRAKLHPEGKEQQKIAGIAIDIQPPLVECFPSDGKLLSGFHHNDSL